MANLLNLTPVQRQLLQQLRSDYERVLLAIKFNDPAEDHTRIRQHAALTGKVEILDEILSAEETAVQSNQQILDTILDGPPKTGQGFEQF